MLGTLRAKEVEHTKWKENERESSNVHLKNEHYMQINRARRKTHPWGHVGGLYPKAFPTSPLSLILTFKFILISDNSNIIVFIIYLFSFLTALPSSLGQE